MARTAPRPARGWDTKTFRRHNPSNYPLAFAHFRTLFRRYGACEVLFYRGYPLDGYSLLRDIKDRTFLLAGVAHNMTTFPDSMGELPPLSDKREWKRKSTRARKDAEHRISRRLSGVDSGLPPDMSGGTRTVGRAFSRRGARRQAFAGTRTAISH